MKQMLQFRQSQQLTMTPQLQQAIKLLQLSSIDLQQEIQQALDSNMMLELEEEENASLSSKPENFVVQPPAELPERESEYPETTNATIGDIPQELSLDLSWEEIYDYHYSTTYSSEQDEESDDFLLHYAPSQTLHDFLLTQVEFAHFNERDYSIALALVDAINEDGYLSASLEEIYQVLSDVIPDIEMEEVKTTLHRIQHFDPPGVGAVDLSDCLRIQIQQLPDTTSHKREALSLVTHYLALLAKKDIVKLKRRMEVSDGVLGEVIALVRRLEPKPGRAMASVELNYIVPDVFVTRQNGQWTVSLNPDISPRVRINPFYSSLVKRANSSVDNVTMKNHLQEARWFIKSLHSRNETLLKVAQSIVERQKDFLEHGQVAMRPLVLRDIAEEIGMHESTVSRVTTQKYIHTPSGIYEFKYFFSSHVSTHTGGECSATAIKAHIKEMIGIEDSTKPLSDDILSKQLQSKGINVARRTIAKYRESMGIPASSDRRRTF